MSFSHPPFTRAVLALALFGAAAAWAQTTSVAPTTTGTTTSTTTQPAPATASVPTNKLVNTFTPLAGSPENATSLVNGLRTGSAITLTSAPAPTTGGAPGGATGGTTGSTAGGTAPTAGEAVTFTSPTKPMGYGNIRIAMSLAEAKLASQGITNPTPTQLQGALVGPTTTGPGGTSTSNDGILQMRASGMGWGQIAHSMGYKLGPIMSGKQTFTDASGATTAAGSHAAGKSVTTAGGATHGKSGVTTAGGGAGNAGGHGKSSAVTAGGGSHGKSSIVTAGGGGGGGVTTGLGHGHAGGASAGSVNASGGKAGGGGGGGQGAGHGKGGGKP